MSISSGEPGNRGAGELTREQEYVGMLYGRLDEMRAHSGRELATALRQTGGTPQARSERDAAIGLHTARVAQLDDVQEGLCFGRLDFAGGEQRYVGRIGIVDDEYDPLLLDWRAPAARPFYVATAAAPDGVQRRRHIRTLGRRVVGLSDEVLDLETARHTGHEGLIGEGTLLAALEAGRTGRMRDIVETIQVEQDRIIRSDLDGVLVVQGGAGTGKTAVALHRAAYLLYTHRRQLSTRGVLVVGPNTAFLRYIQHVLPSLAETGVLLSTVDSLYPGITVERDEAPDVATVKGRLEMSEVLANAVGDRQQVPDDVLEIPFDDDVLHLDRATCVRARDRARRLGRPHNLARPIFVRQVVAALARRRVERLGVDPYADDPLGGDDAPGADATLLDRADELELRDELVADPGVQEALDTLWPVLTPQQLLTDLFAAAERLAAAAPDLTADERDLLRRDPGTGWTPADVPLLDEAAELLGPHGRDDTAQQAREQRERTEYAEGALEIAHGSRSIDLEDEADPELLSITDLLDADRLAERHVEEERRTVAQRAAADRTWTFGHVIVDEAQEISAMAWRQLLRRCPSRSMTLVGDIAQTGDPAGSTSWHDALDPHVAGRWRLEQLTVCYRTPAEIIAVAAPVLTAIDPSLEAPRSVRESGEPPWAARVEPGELAASLADAVRAEADRTPDGTVGVIVPAESIECLGRAVAEAVPGAVFGAHADLESPVVVLTVREAKGLEFDSVLVVDPATIVAESARGYRDLYVALTRSTQRLAVLSTVPLPPELTALEERSATAAQR